MNKALEQVWIDSAAAFPFAGIKVQPAGSSAQKKEMYGNR
jgi:hypothetical protein